MKSRALLFLVVGLVYSLPAIAHAVGGIDAKRRLFWGVVDFEYSELRLDES